MDITLSAMKDSLPIEGGGSGDRDVVGFN